MADPTVFTRKSGSITLSADSLTATQARSSQAYCAVYSGIADLTNFKRYFEICFTAFTDINNAAVGIANALASVDDWLGNNDNAIGIFGTGDLWWGGTTVGGYPEFTAGDILAFAIDDNNKLLWFRNISTGSDWNGDSSADPATGIGGYDITGMVPTSVAASTYWINDKVTANFDGAFVGAVPFGFKRWNGNDVVIAPPPPPPSGSVASFARSSGSITLSDNALTATHTTNDQTSASAFSTLANPANPKRYVEVYLAAIGLVGTVGVGIGNAVASLGVPIGTDASSLGIYDDGELWFDNTVVGYFEFGAGDTLAICVDDTAGLFWVKNVTRGSDWNNNPNAIPANGIGGYDIAGYNFNTIAVSTYTLHDSVTINFAGDFVGTVPFGFTRWNGDPVVPVIAEHGTETYFIRKSDNITLYDNDLAVEQSTNDTVYSSAYSTTADLTNPRRYFEFRFSAIVDVGNVGVGVASLSASVANFMGQTPASVGFFANGELLWGQYSVPGFPDYGADNIVAIAVDDATKMLWIRNVSLGGYWNNDPSADPANAIGGYVVLGLNVFTVGVSTYNIGDAAEFNFDGDFAGEVPSGYKRWNGTPIVIEVVTPVFDPKAGGEFRFYDSTEGHGAGGLEIQNRMSVGDDASILEQPDFSFMVGGTRRKNLFLKGVNSVSIVEGYLVTPPRYVNTLTPPSAALQGARTMVIDATVNTFGNVVEGGGGFQVPVYCDGLAWRIG